MKSNDPNFPELLPLQWDSEFFNVPVYNFDLAGYQTVADAHLEILNSQKGISCRSLIYIHTTPSALELNNKIKSLGATHLDTRNEFELLLDSPLKQKKYSLLQKPDIYTGNMNDQLAQLAITAGEYSRFRKDTNISDEYFEQLYRLWMARSVDLDLADNVIVTRTESGDISGMVTVKSTNKTGYIGLIAVSKGYQGQGIGSELLSYALEYFDQQNCGRIRVVTQNENKPACHHYRNFGFKVIKQTSTFHLWRD